jgi:putative heme degradation protein
MSIEEATVKFQQGKLSVAECVAELRAKKITREQALKMFQDKKISMEVVSAFLEDAEKAKGANGLYCKVREKGAISVYGLQRMPVTLYVEQWDRLFSPEFQELHKQFVTENTNRLARKDRTKVA